MFSIDQNCHSLWDVAPKLAALARRGHAVRHFIEDIDAAFTQVGADAAGRRPAPLRLARERFHHSGGTDWGAALFYTGFLSRQAVDIRQWEPFTGMRTGVLAGRLGRGVADLYEEFSPGDTWQLIGPSYVGDQRHHRILADVTVAETAPLVRELLDRADADMRRAFPGEQSRRRLDEWLPAERGRVEAMLGATAGGTLADLYARWLRVHVPGEVAIERTSALFALAGGWPGRDDLLGLFLRQYDLAAKIYNEAIAESGLSLRPLKTDAGELPFFATLRHEGRLTRSVCYLAEGRAAVQVNDTVLALEDGRRLPRLAMAEAGVECIAGKAVLLVCQVRMGAGGDSLAMPYRGSVYTPAAHLLMRKLDAAGLLPDRPRPITRVRFHLLDRLRSLDTPIRLPPHLAAAMGGEQVPAGRLGDAWADLAAEAARRLEAFGENAGRAEWLRAACPEMLAEVAALDARRRDLAAVNMKDPQLRRMSHRSRELEQRMLDRLVRQIDRDWQVAQLDYYDSRGALLPWCIALGGEAFYNEVLDRADVYEESGP